VNHPKVGGSVSFPPELKTPFLPLISRRRIALGDHSSRREDRCLFPPMTKIDPPLRAREDMKVGGGKVLNTHAKKKGEFSRIKIYHDFCTA